MKPIRSSFVPQRKPLLTAATSEITTAPLAPSTTSASGVRNHRPQTGVDPAGTPTAETMDCEPLRTAR
ncbi:hypothetical protein ATY41_10915 [Leifsonia xyli subsp. xyli]|uniref:Uncharacterized protein n=1 Tax=Leifsonia xyli subsp. xyli TaxID=59736 RepID=A0A1E2SKI8_LEIXY|nr:hypothetical protein ATY41_10915 [Leifsonia xyli subsp. xyli]